ncbi:UPF0098 protein [Thalassobaculum fulvum]|uniref:UPF0098 protein n=2 Tax=Thalassobaculum fulvum TaxID=1633335 RepID=A0A918XPJ8_9PROT|nr:UPF0098 protein [Thalassobaculum fulvum]
MAMRLESPSFQDGAAIPSGHACDGDDLSPALLWSGLPRDCRSLAIVVEDPDAPRGTWHHWGVFDIPPTETGLPEGFPTTARVGSCRQATNDFGRTGYGGPCPPRGHGAHRYRFRLFALSVERLALPNQPTCPELKAAMARHALEEAVLTGLYER